MLFRLTPILLFLLPSLYPVITWPITSIIVLFTLGLTATALGALYPVFRWYVIASIFLGIQYVSLILQNQNALTAGLTALFGGIAVFLLLETGFFTTLLPKDVAKDIAKGISEDRDPVNPWAFRQLISSIVTRTSISVSLGAIVLIITTLAGKAVLAADVFFILLGIASAILIACFLALKPKNDH